MLIHAEGHNRGDAPVKLYQVEENSGCIIVGSALTRVMLTRGEIQDLYKLLSRFVQADTSSIGGSHAEKF
jgi:hypothetical protein